MKSEGGNSPSSAASVRPPSGSTALSGSVHPTPSYEFSSSFESEEVYYGYTIAAVPPYYIFLSSFTFKLEGGSDTCSVATVRPSSGNTALSISVRPATSAKFSFKF